VRYNTDGSLDTDFYTTSIDGLLNFQSSSIAIQPDGKILVGGYVFTEYPGDFPYPVVIRYNSNGTPDAGFGNGGYITSDVYGFSSITSALALQSDGKIVVLSTPYNSGNTPILARYNINGDPDNSLDDDGIVEIDFLAKAVTVQPDQKITVAGAAYTGSPYKLALRRYNTNGSPDVSFSGDGKVITDRVVNENSTFTVKWKDLGFRNSKRWEHAWFNPNAFYQYRRTGP
jgi:uncharacterized delta-60 repeat protein